MSVPTLITDLSQVIASNSPEGTDAPATTDDFLRAHAAFIAQNYANKLDKTGSIVPTANQPMGGYKHTGAGTATAAGQYVVWGQSGAELASPTLTGTPVAPTAAAGAGTTQIATTAFVQAAIAASGSTTSVLDTISASNHITRVLNGADAARRVRPDATYATARYCTPAGAGAHNGTSLADAWSLSELNTALATTGSLHVYMVGTFEPAAYNTAGPLVSLAASAAADVRLDFATYKATMRGYTGASWTASGAEYWTTASSTQRQFRLTENGARMRGVSGSDCGAGNMEITALDAGANTVTVQCYRELQAGDPIAFISGAANGMSPGTAYYVKTATAPSGDPLVQTLTLSTTVGGATLDITGTLSGTRRMWSLASGRYGDPVPGSLQPGEYAWSPSESRVYIRPTSGSPSTNEYGWWQAGSGEFIEANAASGAVDGLEIVGGDFYGAVLAAILLGDSTTNGTVTNARVVGARVRACQGGIITTGAVGTYIGYNEVSDIVDHAIGSKNGDTSEPSMTLEYNWAHDIGTSPFDGLDGQAIVTNPQSNDTSIHGNVIQNVGFVRDLVENPYGLNDSINITGIVIDSSSRVTITGNYIEQVYGNLLVYGANEVQAVTYSRVEGNVFDYRTTDLVPAQAASDQNLIPTGSYAQATSTGTAGYGVDYTNEVNGNLCIAGSVTDFSAVASFGSSALASLRNAKAGAAINCQLKVRDNVVLCLDPNAAWNIMEMRYASGSGSVTGIDSDYNTYYAANATMQAVAIYNSTSPGSSPITTVGLAALGDGTGWTAPDGTVCDKHSTVWATEAEMAGNVATNATVLRCLAV